MDFRILNYFLAVAREQNITKAADFLHVTQPTLSRQIAQLEEELGVKLFERRSHNIALTDDGLFLKRRAEEIISLGEKIRQDLQGNKDSIQGEIAFGCGEYLSVTELVQAMKLFKEKHPLVTYRIFTATSESIMRRLDQGLIDFGLMIEPIPMEKYSFVKMRTKERWGLLVRNDSPLAAKKSVTSEDMLNLPLVVSGRAECEKELEQCLGGNKEKMNVVSRYDLLYNSAIMVRQGLGAAFCLQLEQKFEGLSFVPVEPKFERRTFLAWKEHQIESPAAGAFIKFARDFFKAV